MTFIRLLFFGIQPGENLVKSAKIDYEKVTGEPVPDTTNMELHVREPIERMISGDPGRTRWRACEMDTLVRKGDVTS